MKYLAMTILLAQLGGATLVPGTTETYTDGNVIWEGNPWCAELGLFPARRLIPASELFDPAQSTDTWSDEIGACRNMRLVSASSPAAPDSLGVVP